ncbi:hypothetical protein PR202_ga07846 [Eleusine coracana subsp. coracana]|uniref:Uncharacterized protein n=1 Tax=Eleusine coracana subsp. coracana TaxID=191504 RepID=A0AAV5BYJ2_ELECO|nr:hypothetical protein PR202_ga07846 [Eleusine coracana subsp. coracana]
MEMEFTTDAYKHTGPVCFSPDARFVAVAVDYRLVVRDVASLKVVQLFSCMDKISSVEWAPDSEYILCGLYKRPMVQAWSLSQPDWTCKIDEGQAGIAYARWSPDSRHILTTSEFQLRLTVWSLVNTACVHVQWPKHASRDLAGVEWSPDDSSIVVWDSLLEYKFNQSTLTVQDVSDLLRNITNTASDLFTRWEVPFQEVDRPWQLDMSDSELYLSDGFSCNMQDNGSGMLSWSSDSHYFFTRNDNMPTALWIWDICRLELAAVLVQKDPIRAAAWDPNCPRLALCTESTHLYMWTPSRVACVNVPFPNFRIVDVKWSSDGSRLLLKDRESFCCALPLPEEEPDESDDSTEDE